LEYENIFCSMAEFDVENSTLLLFKECNMTGEWNKCICLTSQLKSPWLKLLVE
jgi:hypothetical protein